MDFAIGIRNDLLSARVLMDTLDVLDMLAAPDRREFRYYGDFDYVSFKFSDELAAEKFRFRFSGTRLPTPDGVEWWKELN